MPLEDAQLAAINVSSSPVLDRLQIFPWTDDIVDAPRRAAEWVYDRYINQTTGAAKMNPGLDVHGNDSVLPPDSGCV